MGSPCSSHAAMRRQRSPRSSPISTNTSQTRRVYVYDNASTDRTVRRRGSGRDRSACADNRKGNVVRKMFAEIDANVYLLADGDDT